MKYVFISVICMAGLLTLINSCLTSSSKTDHDSSQSHNILSQNEKVVENVSYLLRSEKTELFVEFSPMIVGKESWFAAHLTQMHDYKPIEKGPLSVRMIKNGQKITEVSLPAPKAPGLYIPGIIPSQAGIFELQFSFQSENYSDTIRMENVSVYATADEAIHAHSQAENPDEISFGKEQAWNIDFQVEQVAKKSIYDIIRTSGEILTAKGQNNHITNKTAGIVLYQSANLQEGREVRAGEVLFKVNNQGFVDKNIEEKFEISKAKLGQAKSDFERAQTLVQQQIIGTKEFETRKRDYAIATAEFNTLNQGFVKGGKAITAPITGILKNIFVSNGQFVEAGSELAEIATNHKLILEADLSQKHFSKLQSIHSAKFKTPYMEEVKSIEDFNGKILSKGKFADEDGFIPILFEIDNIGSLLPGSFAEIYIQTYPNLHELVIPNSAIMQDYESKYVYVMIGGESFEKKQIKIGLTDGLSSQVLAGLEEGDWIVTKGAYQIKIASLSATIPDHGHSH